MTGARLWVRWSWRDLRRRWGLVATIALVIALGTGTYASLMSTSAWRTRSNDISFALLRTHDLRVSLTQGSTAAEGSLLAMAARIPHSRDILGARERLIVPTQIAGPRDLLVPGELVGTDTRPGPMVDGVWVTEGRGLTAADDGARTVVVESAFASKNGLPTRGALQVSGGTTLAYVGHGQSPEYFIVSGSAGALPFLSQKSYGVLFTTLHTAQLAAGAPGRINDLVLTLRPGADRTVVQRELQAAVAAAQPPMSATTTTRDDIVAYQVLYEDIGADEQMWRVVALLVLLGAAFAALNLTSRIVEAQRREIGIGMALGVPPRLLAVRPLLFGGQVALIGVLLGIVVGWLVDMPLRGVFMDLLPLPVWQTPLQADIFAQAAVLGFVLPFAAVAWPVWRALRVQPVEAIRVGHLAARGRGLSTLARRLRLPGRSYRHIPVRDLLRTPRRTALTALGIAAAITTLVANVGFMDSFNATIDRAEAELLRAAPDRVTVSLDSFVPAAGPVVAAVRALPPVAAVEPGLILPATASSGGRSLDLVTQVVPAGAAWTPTLTSGRLNGGIVLADKAARDLRVRVGDTITLEHPQATATGLRTARTPVRVAGIHPSPVRLLAYLDPASAARFGFAGAANALTVLPAAGARSVDVRRALLAVPHVASAESARATTEGMRSRLQEFLDVLQVAALITLLLVLLIAFNTTSIGMDERSREHATMLAFGLPGRTVLGMTTVETVLIGVLGTLTGMLGGYVVLRWMASTTIPQVLPDIGVTASLSRTTLIGVFAIGVLTVALAPLFTVRRLRRMDIPATLRVIE